AYAVFAISHIAEKNTSDRLYPRNRLNRFVSDTAHLPNGLSGSIIDCKRYIMSVSSPSTRHEGFWQLHQSGCFIIPNPWDIGSARWLARAGFKALASTSSGFAFSRGHGDGDMGVDDVLQHCHELVQATNLPVNADFEDGHARDIPTLKENVRRCVATGVSGLSIEDATGDADKPLYDRDEAAKRMRAAREAIDATGENV